MKVLRTPDKYFENIKDYPFAPIYTNIQTADGTTLRVHHIFQVHVPYEFSFVYMAYDILLTLS